jgi:hypothetical protein
MAQALPMAQTLPALTTHARPTSSIPELIPAIRELRATPTVRLLVSPTAVTTLALTPLVLTTVVLPTKLIPVSTLTDQVLTVTPAVLAATEALV